MGNATTRSIERMAAAMGAPGSHSVPIEFHTHCDELLYGAAKSHRPVAALERLRELINLLPALSLSETAVEAYGTIRAELQANGEMIGNNDLWIAAHALASKLTLVTNKEREFQRVRGLKVQNWAK